MEDKEKETKNKVNIKTNTFLSFGGVETTVGGCDLKHVLGHPGTFDKVNCP
jgi:hypothetical protein